MKQELEKTINLTNAYDVIGDGYLNIIKVDDIKKVLVLFKDNKQVYYLKPSEINNNKEIVYNYLFLYRSNINDFNGLYKKKLIDSLENYDIKTQHYVLKWLIYLVDNGDWTKNWDNKFVTLDISLIIKVIDDIISYYNQNNKLKESSEYFINNERIVNRWGIFHQYTVHKTKIGITTTNNPYVILYHNDYSKDMVFVSIKDLKQIYRIKNDVFNEFYFQKISKFNYTKYHSSYQDETLMLSIFDRIVQNQENNELKIYEIDDKNELSLTNDVDYLRFSLDQYIENIPYDSKNGEKFWKLRDKLDKRR